MKVEFLAAAREEFLNAVLRRGLENDLQNG